MIVTEITNRGDLRRLVLHNAAVIRDYAEKTLGRQFAAEVAADNSITPYLRVDGAA